MLKPTLALVFAPLLSSLLQAAQPNVVFVMADDVGLGDIGYYHKQRTGEPAVVPTPHLDALAQAGMRFSDAHSSTALCSPSRYCAMSGNLCHRSYAPWGVWQTFRPSPFKEGDTTLGRLAKRAGLATAFIGKWHLGGDFRDAENKGIFRGNDHGATPEQVDASRLVAGGPQSIGFDTSYTLPCGIQGPTYVAYENGVWSPFADDSELIYFTSDSGGDPAFVSDKGPGVGDSRWDTVSIGSRLGSKATAFIEREAANDKPFFLCYWTPMVHLPHLPPREFDGRQVRGAAPSHHLDMVIDLDQQVGRLVSSLKETGVYNNTLFIFSSDNGGLNEGKGQRAGHDSSGGYRGFKNQPYEGGHRVPFFAVWPGHIEPGTESAEPIAVHDIAATMAAVLGQPLTDEQAKDSLNLLPLLEGDTDFAGRDEFLLQGGSGNQLIYRRGDWKLIIQTNPKLTKWEPLALFNLTETPLESELNNLVNDPQQKTRVDAMMKRYRELRDSGVRTTPLPRIGG